MSKSTKTSKPTLACTECGWTTVRWVGRCGECQAWGTLVEQGAPKVKVAPAAVTVPAVPIGLVDLTEAKVRPSGLGELDRVLGGGLVPGAVLLVSGEPGVGKSTMLLEVAARAARTGQTVLYVTGEESCAQVRLRAERIGALDDKLLIAAETDLATALGHIEAANPGLLIVDSVQTLSTSEVEGGPGGVAQVREVAGALIRTAKERHLTTVLVGHVTKDGTVAGPRTLEHLVDVVLTIEGDRHNRLRLMRCLKNRYGAADEIGCFELVDSGIAEVPDPSQLFITRRSDPVPGTCLTVALEGSRPLVAEVQALVGNAVQGPARRTTSGVDNSRVALTIAVATRHGMNDLPSRELYVSTVGGVKLTEPAVDLAVVLAIISSHLDAPLPPDLVAVGEVGLSGEIRQITGMSRRLSEVKRLGFAAAVVPAETPHGDGPALVRVATVADCVTFVRQLLRGD